MRLIRLSLVVCLLAVSTVAVAQDTIPISDLHFNDPAGVPLLLDQIVTFQGVVTVPTGVFHSGRTEVYLQDDTGGMNLFTFDSDTSYALGDEVKVTGTVIFFNGLTEVDPISSELIATNQPIPAPLLLTCAELRDSYNFETNFEANESRLVRLKNVTWDSGNFALMDDTGTAMMYIPAATGLRGLEILEGEFNVVGVIKQFDDAGEEGPWYLGYEVLPRYISDLTVGAGPQFVSFPVQTDVAMAGATLNWTTDVDAETVLEYGTTTDFELDAIRLGNSTTSHEVVLTGLLSATVYYVRAVAADDSGSINSPTITVVAPSENSSGQVDVYFSKSVDTTYSTGVDAVETNLALRFIELADAATTSIDFCFANVTHDGVTDALIAAHDRGVTVQVIYEEFDPVINELTVAGVEVRTDPDDEHENTHNKFSIFDSRDGDETTSRVWTGSWNATFNGTNVNAENAVVIHDAALAAAYTLEFDEMWGGTYSNDKGDNTPHLFIINGMRVEQYMSPSDGLRGVMADLIATADSDLLFAIYNFTEDTIFDALVSSVDAGVSLRGVYDADNAEFEFSNFQPLVDAGVDGVLSNVDGGGTSVQMHHKYLLTDPLDGGTDPIIMTGSYNWTNSASDFKDENIVIFHDATLANIFFQEWMARYHEGGGTWDYEVPEGLAADFSWDPMSPAVDEMVTFTDASTGTPTAWAWDFGDGGASTEQSPTYSYAAAGTYSVSLMVTNDDGSDSASMEITVESQGTTDNFYFFPAAAKAGGAADSFFLTDATVNNAGDAMATFMFGWLPRGSDNSEPEMSEAFTLEAGTSVVYTDVLGAAFGLEDGAVGSLMVASGSMDLLLMSRTYNQLPAKAGGTFGQAFPGYAMADLIPANSRMRILFFVENDAFRSNLGLMNGTTADITIKWERFLADGTSVETGFTNLPAWGNVQINTVFADEAPVNGGYVDVWTETADGLFATYGSLLDNATSDPTTVLPQ